MGPIDAIYRHRRDRHIWAIALLLHIAFIIAWRLTDTDLHRDIERNSVTVAMCAAVIFYSIIVVAFWQAQKTRLNKALALNKTFWGLLIGMFGLPAQTGWWEPAPQWVRAYIWIGLSLTIVWVLWEFVQVNWCRRDGYPWVERRINVRREADRELLTRLALVEIENMRLRKQVTE